MLLEQVYLTNHAIKCYSEQIIRCREYVSYISVDDDKYHIAIGFVNLNIPHAHYFKIDYSKIMAKLGYPGDRNRMNIIDESFDQKTEFIGLILEEEVACPLCGTYFDSFPCIDVMMGHLIKCSVHPSPLPDS